MRAAVGAGNEEPMATKKTGGKVDPNLGELAAQAAKARQMLVRLKPYDPKRGYVLMRYSMCGILFEESKGWYRVDPHIAEKLEDVRCRPDMPDHPHYGLNAFDVCTPEEARRIANAENEQAVTQGRALPHNPNEIEVRARDVTSGTPMGPDEALVDLAPPARPNAPRAAATASPAPAAKRPRLAPEGGGRSVRPG